MSTLSDFCEHILGHDEYIFTNKVVHNKWFYFTNIVKYVPLPFEGEPKKAIPSNIDDFDEQDINRLKLVLVEKKKTGKWLAEQIGKDPSTISKWCSNTTQPSLDTLVDIANVLNINVTELIIANRQE